jgi:hypothetical protein
VLDAVRVLGVQSVEMPFTPQRIWAKLQQAKEGQRGAA